MVSQQGGPPRPPPPLPTERRSTQNAGEPPVWGRAPGLPAAAATACAERPPRTRSRGCHRACEPAGAAQPRQVGQRRGCRRLVPAAFRFCRRQTQPPLARPPPSPLPGGGGLTHVVGCRRPAAGRRGPGCSILAWGEEREGMFDFGGRRGGRQVRGGGECTPQTGAGTGREGGGGRWARQSRSATVCGPNQAQKGNYHKSPRY